MSEIEHDYRKCAVLFTARSNITRYFELLPILPFFRCVTDAQTGGGWCHLSLCLHLQNGEGPIRIRTCGCMYWCMHACMHMHAYACICMHACMHQYMHPHVRIRMGPSPFCRCKHRERWHHPPPVCASVTHRKNGKIGNNSKYLVMLDRAVNKTAHFR